MHLPSAIDRRPFYAVQRGATKPARSDDPQVREPRKSVGTPIPRTRNRGADVFPQIPFPHLESGKRYEPSLNDKICFEKPTPTEEEIIHQRKLSPSYHSKEMWVENASRET